MKSPLNVADSSRPSLRCGQHRRDVRCHLRPHQVHHQRGEPPSRHHHLQATTVRRKRSQGLEFYDGELGGISNFWVLLTYLVRELSWLLSKNIDRVRLKTSNKNEEYSFDRFKMTE